MAYRGTTGAPEDPAFWVDFFTSQTGAGGFVGDPFQRGGFALGGLLKGLSRVIFPVLKRAGKSVAKQALKTGVAVAQDALAGRNVGEAFEEHGRAAASRLVKKAAKSVNPGTKPKRRRLGQRGGNQLGQFKSSNRDLVLSKNIKAQKRRRKEDILGEYFI